MTSDSWRVLAILVSSASSSARLTILPAPRASISRSFNADMMSRSAPTRVLSPDFMASFICADDGVAQGNGFRHIETPACVGLTSGAGGA